MRDLLYGVRALAAVFRLGGRYRVASIVGSVVTIVGFLWFVIVPRADAAEPAATGRALVASADSVGAVAGVYALWFLVVLAACGVALALADRDRRANGYADADTNGIANDHADRNAVWNAYYAAACADRDRDRDGGADAGPWGSQRDCSGSVRGRADRRTVGAADVDWRADGAVSGRDAGLHVPAPVIPL